MSWLSIIIISYFLLAFVNLFDKFLLDKVLGDSQVYAFIISLLGSAALLAAPWFLLWPGWGLLIFQLAVGAIFPLALYLMFQGLKHGDASKITVIIGGLIPIFTIIFSLIFLHERLALNQWIAVFYLLLGTFMIALVASDGKSGRQETAKNKKTAFYFSLGAAFVYALFFIGTKYTYNSHDFASSFIWIRLGSLLGALLMIIRAKDRRKIFGSLKSGQASGSPKNRFLVIGNQALGASSFILQNYAISLGSVAIVNALQGVQYVFILILGWLFTVFNPKVISENISRAVLVPKIIAVLLVAFGLYFLII
jgi:drug/metabolite transporter (DMT)-like permease